MLLDATKETLKFLTDLPSARSALARGFSSSFRV